MISPPISHNLSFCQAKRVLACHLLHGPRNTLEIVERLSLAHEDLCGVVTGVE